MVKNLHKLLLVDWSVQHYPRTLSFTFIWLLLVNLEVRQLSCWIAVVNPYLLCPSTLPALQLLVPPPAVMILVPSIGRKCCATTWASTFSSSIAVSALTERQADTQTERLERLAQAQQGIVAIGLWQPNENAPQCVAARGRINLSVWQMKCLSHLIKFRTIECASQFSRFPHFSPASVVYYANASSRSRVGRGRRMRRGGDSCCLRRVANLSSFNFHLASCRVNDVVDNTQELVSRRTSWQTERQWDRQTERHTVGRVESQLSFWLRFAFSHCICSVSSFAVCRLPLVVCFDAPWQITSQLASHIRLVGRSSAGCSFA